LIFKITVRENQMILPKHTRKGIALVTIIMMLLIFSILGVSVAGLTTGQYRFALKRNSDIASRQAALAAVAKAQYLLAVNSDWLQAPSFLVVNNHYYPQSDRYCTIDLIPASCSATMCSLVAWGYAKNQAGQPVWKKGVQVTFRRDAPVYAVMSQAPTSSLEMETCSVQGKLATLQMNDIVTFNALAALNPSGKIVLSTPPGSKVYVDESPPPGVIVVEEKEVEPPQAVVIPDLSAAPSYYHSATDVSLARHDFNIIDVQDCGIYLSAGTQNIDQLKGVNVTFHIYGPVRLNIKSSMDLQNCTINPGGYCRNFIIYADSGASSLVYNTAGAFMVTGFSDLVGKYNTIEGSLVGNSIKIGVTTVGVPDSIQKGGPTAVYWQEL
jgi:Tfp pilus assembly protein PilX